jgi:CheY-like chemotaxis protein
MRKILLVDDDPLVLKLYQEGLEGLGAQVTTAVDGLAAIRALHSAKPDVVVLDLMMPKFSGVDVLRFIRSEAGLNALPVVVLGNSFMNDLAAEAARLGVQKALLKVHSSPSILLEAINDVLSGRAGSQDTTFLLFAAEQSPPNPEPPKPGQPLAQGTAGPPREGAPPATDEFRTKTRQAFLQNAPSTCASLRSLCKAFTAASDPAKRAGHLHALNRKVHSIAATAGLAEYHCLARMASAFEALLCDITDKPTAVNPSVVRTIVNTVDLLALLSDRVRGPDVETPLSAQALVVDDDPLSNRLVVSALQRAQIQARSTEDPLVALQWLEESQFDLIILDIQMPVMDGFELCMRLRTMPGYERTPVIYVTAHGDFENRTKSVLTGANDLIAKPVFPMDLAVKAVALLVKRQLAPA